MSRCQPQCGCHHSPPPHHVDNSINTQHNYHARCATLARPWNCGCQQYSHGIHHHQCGHAPAPNCGCNGAANYGGCGGSSHGHGGCGPSYAMQYTGSVPVSAAAGDYTIVDELPPGKYMITKADNVAGGDLFLGSSMIAKTIGTEITVLANSLLKFTVATANALPIVVRLTRID